MLAALVVLAPGVLLGVKLRSGKAKALGGDTSDGGGRQATGDVRRATSKDLGATWLGIFPVH